MHYARKDLLTWEKGMFYHIYNRGVHQKSIFRERAHYLSVIGKLKEYARKNQITVIAYCLMPSHYHICARQDGDAPAGNLPRYGFNSYTKACNLCYDTIQAVEVPDDWFNSYTKACNLCYLRRVHAAPAHAQFNSYTKAYNLCYAHSDTLFEERFRAKPIQTTSHLLHLCRYIHGNPVKDGLVAHPADWEYSN